MNDRCPICDRRLDAGTPDPAAASDLRPLKTATPQNPAGESGRSILEKTVPIPRADAAKYRPFCSLRCQQVDLVRWMDGKYAIIEPVDDLEDPSLADVPRVFDVGDD